jgi:DNA replication and repair protein RecF
MQLTKFRVHNFRNHLDTLLEFGDGVNVLVGDNGQGKTNIIEAISYLCLT